MDGKAAIRILVVDDEEGMRNLLAIMLKKEGYDVTVASNGDEAIRASEKEIFDLVITDVRMPKISGMEVLRAIKEISPETIVLVMTAYSSTESVIEAMRGGAYDYVTKPFQVDEVKITIANALERKRLRLENQQLKQELVSQASFGNIVGKGPAMQKTMDLVRKVADTTSNVLICGESGTGKELIARAIHYGGQRRDNPFVAINCSALPETLLESELFGHMKGSFTGAHSNKEGLFEAAHGGTIFLDEIGDVPFSIQAKLLRVLEEKKFRRIGGIKEIEVDVRIIAATNRDLARAVAEGSFREDLYYRLDVIPVYLPPLRERPEDIPLLAEHFLKNASQVAGKKIKGITPEALKVLIGCEWKGNVRELENLIERVVALTDREWIEEEDIVSCFHRAPSGRNLFSSVIPTDGVDLERVIEKLEKDFLLKALEQTQWVKKEAAQLLKMNLRSLRYRLAKYGIATEKREEEKDE